jgi:hypothetical protein
VPSPSKRAGGTLARWRARISPRTALRILFALAVSGCVTIPISKDLPSRFSQEQVAKIEKGVTTRDATLEILGEPDLRRGQETFYYGWAGSSFVAPWLVATAGGGAGGVVGGSGELHLFTVAFDDKGIVKDLRLDPATDNFNDVVNLNVGTSTAELRILAPEADDAEAKLFRAPPNRCAIYVYGGGFPTTSLGQLSLDGRSVVPVLAGVFSSYYVMVTSAPSSHSLSQSGPRSPAYLTITCAPGELVFVRAGLPWYGGKTLLMERVDESEGRGAISAHRRILTKFAQY